MDQESPKPIQSGGLPLEKPSGLVEWDPSHSCGALSSPWGKCAMCHRHHPNRQKEAAAFDRKLFEYMSVARIENISEHTTNLKLTHCSCGSQNISLLSWNMIEFYVDEAQNDTLGSVCSDSLRL